MAHNTGEVSDKPWSEVNKSELPYACFCPVGDASKKATWHLPHHEGAGGIDPDTGMYRERGPLNRAGVHNCAARFNQTEFDNGSDKKTSARHLVEAYRYMGEEAPEVLTDAARSEEGAGPAPQPDAAMARAERGGAPDEAQLAKINALARSPLAAEGVYAFPIIISTDKLDSWGTRMHESSLRNFARDAQGSLPWMNSHRTGGFFRTAELPHGRIFDGEFVSDGQRQMVREMVYMQRGIELNGQGNDDLIAALDGGTVRETSVGFDIRPPLAPDGRYECSICGRNLFDPACAHIPLMWYAADGTPAQQNAAGAVLAFAWVMNAHQVEGSMVWKGATPGAVVEKARAHAVELGEENVKRLEQAYGVRLFDEEGTPIKSAEGTEAREEEVIQPVSNGTASNGTASNGNETGTASDGNETGTAPVAEEAPPEPNAPGERTLRLADVVEQVRAVDGALADQVNEAGAITPLIERLDVLRESARQAEQETEQAAHALVAAEARASDLEHERDLLADRVQALTPAAAEGRAWREDLIRQAVEARVRAQGNAFDAEGYRATLRGAEVAYIRSEIAAHEKAARELFGAGRPTRTPAQPPSRNVVEHSSAYQG